MTDPVRSKNVRLLLLLLVVVVVLFTLTVMGHIK